MLRLPKIMLAKEAACRRNFALNAKLNSPKSPETLYDVLNVRHDCSSQDIRNAYLKLSKQYHPDVKSNGANVTGTARFVQITEAYQTLIKSSTRREYDDSLLWSPGGKREVVQPWDVRPTYDPDPGPYYGIKGVQRVSNWQVALVLLSLGILGAIFGFSSVKHSFEVNRQIQDEISAEANSHHAAVVADAQKYGNQEQMRRMIERISRDPLSRTATK